MRWLVGLAALLLALPAQAFVDIEWVEIGDPDNAPDALANCYAQSCGSVPYTYFIARYEVTNAQYVEFLNAKAASDPLSLYSTLMGSDAQGGITRSGGDGSYTYSVKPGFANKPVNFVSFYDALRFANWLNNGQGSADTESGAYTLLGGTVIPSNGGGNRNAGANVFLPSENEWYKAAYYDGLSGTYFDYPTATDTATVCSSPSGTANRANCDGVRGELTEVGAFSGSASPNGTFDQGGNVWEWNEQVVDGSLRGLRGGSWLQLAGFLAAANKFKGNPSFETSDEFGFRVASLVPEPDASLLGLTSLACLAALTRRRGARSLDAAIRATTALAPLGTRVQRDA